jgi:hypothetical protein
VQVANRWSRGTSEVLVVGLHMVGRFEYGFVLKALENLWSKKIRGASLLFLYFILFPSHFSLFLFSLYSSYFSYFSYLLIIIIFFFFFIFSFCSSKLFATWYLHSICVREWLLPHAWTMLVLEHKREGK